LRPRERPIDAGPRHHAEVTSSGVLDPSAGAIQWTPAAGYAFTGVQVLPDLNADAQLIVCDEAGVCTGLLVAGPLRREMTFPGDEVATLPQGVGAVDAAADATGDGIPDLWVVGPGDGTSLLAGPFDGAVAEGPELEGGLLDVNDDGILDLATFGDPRPAGHSVSPWIEIRFGPSSRWEGDADIVLDPSCDADLDMSTWNFAWPTIHPDFTGDGQRKLDISAYGWADHCRGWILPVPGPGRYDPSLDPNAFTVETHLQLVPDQTGDGMVDALFLSRTSGTPDTLVQGPLSFDSSGVASGVAVLGDIPEHLTQLHAIDLDLDGDGLSELLARTEGGTTLVYSGVDGLTGGATGSTWEGSTDRAFLEGGTASVLFASGGAVTVVDLGEAVPVDGSLGR
jgi:hypothetical protein